METIELCVGIIIVILYFEFRHKFNSLNRKEHLKCHSLHLIFFTNNGYFDQRIAPQVYYCIAQDYTFSTQKSTVVNSILPFWAI